jgi:PTH1 family peptidyl-tRNA hydrolase
MKLIVGLGNPGEKYESTRHNMGFMVVDEVAKLHETTFRLENQYHAQNADFNVGEERVKLVKPQTFMNNSGESVELMRNYYKLDTEDIWVVHDDVDLEFGKVKIQLGGSSAGHKGIESIIHHLNTEAFWRIRVGVGRSEQIPTDEWVLKNFENKEKVAKIIDGTAHFVLESVSEGIENQNIIVEGESR